MNQRGTIAIQLGRSFQWHSKPATDESPTFPATADCLATTPNVFAADSLKAFLGRGRRCLGEDDTALDLPSGKRISLQFKKAEQRYFALVRERISEILALSAPLEEEPETSHAISESG